MRVLVAIIAPIYWSLAHTGGDAQNGFLLSQGTFRHESQLEFATGEMPGPLAEECQGTPGAAMPGPAPLILHLPSAPSLGSQPGTGLSSTVEMELFGSAMAATHHCPPLPGDLLRVTHLARGTDAAGALLLESEVRGSVPAGISEAVVQVLALPTLPAGP